MEDLGEVEQTVTAMVEEVEVLAVVARVQKTVAIQRVLAAVPTIPARTRTTRRA